MGCEKREADHSRIAGCYLQPAKDKRGFSEPLLTVPSATPPGLFIQSLAWSLKTHTRLDFVCCRQVLGKGSEELGAEAGGWQRPVNRLQ